MPRIVPESEKAYAVDLILSGEGQREIEKKTGLSRPFIRKLAKQIGHQFPRNGKEIVGTLCMCGNCGAFFRRPNSKVIYSKNQFCDELCKHAYQKGPSHPAWKDGRASSTFSAWAKNQSAYDDFRKAVLEKYGNKCAISGRTDNIEVHHIIPKAENISPELAFDPNNGLPICKEVHTKIHQLIHEGKGFEEAIEILKKEYANGQGN